MKDFNYANVMQVPKIQKIVVHVTLGEATQNIKLLEAAEKELAAITGQKPLVTKIEEGDCRLQAEAERPDRCEGNPSRRTHVRVS